MSDDKERKLNSIGDVLRQRGKKIQNDDIGDVWEEQKIIRKEDRLLREKYKESKRRARQLKKKIRSNQMGETKGALVELPKVAKSTARKINNLYARNATVKKNAVSKRATAKQESNLSKKIVTVLAIFLVASGMIYISRDGGSNDSPAAILGQSADGSEQADVNQSDIPIVSTTGFDLMFPSGKNKSNTEVVRVSPQDKVPAYAYVDDYQEAALQISQQELPPEFVNNPEEELANLAEGFQATSVIELDGEKIYHGYSDKNGEVQSLLFIKNNLLVFIASDKKLTDENWVLYILSLK